MFYPITQVASMTFGMLPTIFVFGILAIPQTESMPVASHHSTKKAATGRLQQIKIESDGSFTDAHEALEDGAVLDQSVEDIELIGPDSEEENVVTQHGATVRSQVHEKSGFSMSRKQATPEADSPIVRVTRPQRQVESVVRGEADLTSTVMQTNTRRHGASGGRFQKHEVTEEEEVSSVPVIKRQSNVPVQEKKATPVVIKAHQAKAPAPAPLLEDDDADEPSPKSLADSPASDDDADDASDSIPNTMLVDLKDSEKTLAATTNPTENAEVLAKTLAAATNTKVNAEVPVEKLAAATKMRKSQGSTQGSFLTTGQKTKDAAKGQRYVQKMRSMSGGAFYLVDLCFGLEEEQQQCFAGIPDTGSFEIVVRSTLCKETGCAGPMYNANLSSSFELDTTANGTVLLSYGSGPVEAVHGFEKVCVDHDSRICVDHQSVLLTTETTIDALADGEIIGIFGVGRGEKEGREDRFITNLGMTRYSVCLETNETQDGEFVWNEVDVSNDPSYSQIDIFGKVHWAAKLTDMRLGLKENGNDIHQSLPLDCQDGCGAILDSGTTFITPPQQTLDHLSEYMLKNNFTCEDWASLPDLKFNFGSTEYVLPANAYIALVEAEEIPDWLKERLHFTPAQQHTCMFLFINPMGQDTQQGPAMIMGMPFFRYYKTIFDYKNKTAWAAPHSHCKTGVENIQSSWQKAPPMRMDFQKLLPRDQKMALGQI